MRTAPPPNVFVVKAKPDRLEDPNESVVDDFEDEDVQAAVDELAPMCDEHRRRSFQWYYDIGTVVREHYEKQRKQHENMYGQRFFCRLARDLNRPNVDSHLLYECFKLVETYSEEEYLALSRHDAISPTHALMLGGIGDDDIRAKLEEKVISENLTTKQLFDATKEAFGVRRQPGAGRPPKRPKKLKDAFLHLTAQAQRFVKNNSQVWFGGEYDIVSELKKCPVDKLTDELKKQITEAAEQCDKLAAAATKDAKALREALAAVDDRIKAQKEPEEQLQEQDEAEQQLDDDDWTVVPVSTDQTARRSHRDQWEIGRAARVSNAV